MHSRLLASVSLVAIVLGSTTLTASPPTSAKTDQPAEPIAEPQTEDKWIPLFNGKNLDGWILKFAGSELGHDELDTVRVEDGVMKICYDRYDTFGGRFGHIFYKTPFSDYRLRVEYRFVGEQVPGGPGWAYRNSGIMIHCQAPETMRKDQPFPVSIEVQLLGGDGHNERHTANLCTPGTHVVYQGKLHRQHCTDSATKTYHGDQWVSVEVEVRNHERIRHIIDGQTVLEYTLPQLDPDDPDARRLMETHALLLDDGYIALQAESHPVEFRRVEIMPLDDE